MTKEEFYIKWLEAFGSGIPKSKIEPYVKATGNYIWHIFSWELIEESKYLSGEEAKKAYDQTDKSGALYLDWIEEEHTKDMTWDLSNAKALDALAEIYVVDKDFTWTYIKTHEAMCGPYFMKRK